MNSINPQSNLARPFVIVGGGGHANVVADLLLASNCSILGYADVSGSRANFAPYLGNDQKVYQFATSEIYIAIGIGSLPGHNLRKRLFEKFLSSGYSIPPLIHPSAYVARTAKVADGAQIMAGAVVQANTEIERNVIINTGASIDHDCYVAQNCHISPRATLCGSVRLMESTHIGVNAAILQNITVGSSSVIGAGAIVRRSVGNDTIVYGFDSTKTTKKLNND